MTVDWPTKFSGHGIGILEIDDEPWNEEFAITINVKGELIGATLSDLTIKKWVDIESLYMNLIVQAIEGKNDAEERINSLNIELDFLKEKLIEYLKEVQRSFNVHEFRSLQPKKFELLNTFLFDDKDKVAMSSTEETLMVNFNYTNILDQYINLEMPSNTKFSNIHGNLKNKFEDIIFGYGHTQGSLYNKIKTSGIIAARKNLKRYLYNLSESNDGSIREFIDSKEPFKVKIIGHSCGMSDGSILRQIFESDNCEEIIIYHLGRADFQSKQSSILDLSDNDELVMDKIANLKESRSFLKKIN